MKKQYAKIDHYGKLLIPLSLLEKVVAECYICDTDYQDGETYISKLEPVKKVEIVSGEEVDNVRMHNKLSA